MGFGSFITGERGQRIVLKSGLVPIRFPSRKIITRNQITNEIK
jgi:phosphate transport system substrate-binding protein